MQNESCIVCVGMYKWLLLGVTCVCTTVENNCGGGRELRVTFEQNVSGDDFNLQSGDISTRRV